MLTPLNFSQKGDGKRPSCTRCQRSSVDCHWINERNPPAPGTQSQQLGTPQSIHGSQRVENATLENSTSPLPNRPNTSIPYPDDGNQISFLDHIYKSTEYPEISLQSPHVARLFRHYIDNLAPWYDLNDRKRHFEDIVPTRARENALLLSAILAFAAANIHYSSPTDEERPGKENLLNVAEFYHLESVRKLIEITSDSDNLQDSSVVEETLAAICLLRSYEIISR